MSGLLLAVEQAASNTSVFPWLELAVGFVVGSGVTGVLANRIFDRADRRRTAQAEAAAVVVAWVEYPYRIRRRTSDSPEVLAGLAACGHDLQERLARAEAWLNADKPRIAASFEATVATAKGAIGSLIEEAWISDPIDVPEGMILDGWGKEEAKQAQAAITLFQHELRRRWWKLWRSE